MAPTHNKIGLKAALGSWIFSWLAASILDMYIISANLARSLVWNEIPVPGRVIHREAEFRLTPLKRVNTNKGILIYNNNARK
jgi:hypothetical protein